MAFKKAAPVKGKTEKKLPPWLKPEAVVSTARVIRSPEAWIDSAVRLRSRAATSRDSSRSLRPSMARASRPISSRRTTLVFAV